MAMDIEQAETIQWNVEAIDDIMNYPKEEHDYLTQVLNEVLEGNINRARSLRVYAKHYLSLIRFIVTHTSAMEQLRELNEQAGLLLQQQTNEK